MNAPASCAWLSYRFAPSTFCCAACGAVSLYTLAKEMKTFIADFHAWAAPHLLCVLPKVERSPKFPNNPGGTP